MDSPTDHILEQFSRQMAELIRHVGEVRKSNIRLEAGFAELCKRQERLEAGQESLRQGYERLESRLDAVCERTSRLEEAVGQLKSDVGALHTKIDGVEERLSFKIACLVDVVSTDIANERVNMRMHHVCFHQAYDKRMSSAETRLDNLEAGHCLNTA